MLPAPETRDFLLVGYRFLTGLFREFHDGEPPRLVRPTNEDFPFAHLEGTALARALFEQTATYVGVDPAEYRLETHRSRAQSSSVTDPGTFGATHESWRTVAGTYSVDAQGRPVITYDEANVRETDALVATFAHELAHDLLHVADVELPGPPEADEPMTDLASAYLGFGIFGANAAHDFRHVGDGLRVGYAVSRRGYLSVVEWGYALAVFAHVHAIDPSSVRRHLSRVAEEAFVAGHREIARHRAAEIVAIREARPLDDEALAGASTPRFGAHVEAPRLFARLLGRD